MSLIDVCYEQIKDNYWYGIFGDFKVIVDKSTGFFNATKLCASGGKRFDNWFQNQQSKELLEYYDNLVSWKSMRLKSYKIQPKGTNKLDLLVTGTYVREEIILNLACWISNDFYDKCYRIIRDFYIQDFNKIKTDNETLHIKLEEVEKSITKLSLENLKLKQVATPFTSDPELVNCFAIVDKRDPFEEYPYYAIRTQRRNFKRAYAIVKARYPSCDIIYQKNRDPNSVKLFNLMQEDQMIESNFNHFKSHLLGKDMCKRIDVLYETLIGC